MENITTPANLGRSAVMLCPSINAMALGCHACKILMWASYFIQFSSLYCRRRIQLDKFFMFPGWLLGFCGFCLPYFWMSFKCHSTA